MLLAVLLALSATVQPGFSELGDSGCFICKTINWEFLGKLYSYEIKMPCDDLLRLHDFYAQRSRTADYKAYIEDQGTAQLWGVLYHLYGVLNYLQSEARKQKLDYKAKIEFFATFVQNVKYVSDPRGHEIRKFPLETLLLGGDCEDKSILLAWLLKQAGFRVALLEFDDHVAVGVNLPSEPFFAYEAWYFLYAGRKYYYMEATSPGWRLGQVPKKYQGKTARIYLLN